ncbi:MAG: tRNA glutamyl-Q(34) synthetase GluQRS [Nitrosomonadales bacterium]|nr:tRNA glutamyl-Q(34) synthetase GluQRS [Nitrosomonadales bacterium]
MPEPTYRGRFAPSPTGPLHFGSLVAAVGSYLDAKHHHGIWLVRMEDLDAPRCIAGAADNILRTLEVYGLHWDDVRRALPAELSGEARPTVMYQSQRTAAYEEALQKLQSIDAVYPCCCTRKEIADSALHGIEGPVYPGTCRNGIPQGKEARAWRVRTNNIFRHSRAGGNPAIQNAFYLNPLDSRFRGNDEVSSAEGIIRFNDAIQGSVSQRLETDIGDFVVKRADGLFAYQLAVVVDDAFQGITHIVRGADLLASTPRQIWLQRLLGLNTPAYMHLPVAINEAGEKLSKQTLAAPVNSNDPSGTLWRALTFLRQEPPAELISCRPEEILEWAVVHWDGDNLKGIAAAAC